MSDDKGWRVAVLGATGLVGSAIIKLLEERDFPVRELHALGTDRSIGEDATFRGKRHPVQDADGFDFARADLALFAASAAAARQYAPRAAAAGCFVVDDSAEHRHQEGVPLVVPEVNPEAVAAMDARRLVASPAGISVPLLLALKPLRDAAGLERVSIATYQSASGAGKAAIDALAEQSVALMSGRGIKPPRGGGAQLAFNAVPQVDEFGDDGYTAEEWTLARDLRKVLGDAQLRVAATAVRVPVFFGHSAVLTIETRRKIGAAEARTVLQAAPGVEVQDLPRAGGYPTAVQAANHDTVYVGRIREDMSHEFGLVLWIVADNVRKGAANGVQIAEILVRGHL